MVVHYGTSEEQADKQVLQSSFTGFDELSDVIDSSTVSLAHVCTHLNNILLTNAQPKAVHINNDNYKDN